MTHRHGDTSTDIQKHRHGDTSTDTGTQTWRHIDRRHTGMETHRHGDTSTDTGTQTWRHRHGDIYRHGDTDMETQTGDTQAWRHIGMETHL